RSYSDQFSLGIRNAFGDWNAEATVSHIRSKDGVAAFLGNRREGGAFFAPGTSWGPPWGQNFAPFGTLALIDNALETKSNALYLKADKPYPLESRWRVPLEIGRAHVRTPV